jgi:hypothetical protein
MIPTAPPPAALLPGALAARPAPLRALRLGLLAAMGLSACAGGKPDDPGDDGGGEIGGGVGGDGADGGADGAADGGDGGDGGGDGGTGEACVDPTPILSAAGEPTGYVRCADGAIDREAAVPAPTEIDGARCMGTEDIFDCRTDDDCGVRPYGACLTYAGFDSPSTYCACAYACATDADCGDGQICLTAGIVETGTSWSTCVDATCVTNADCASGECGVASYDNGCGYTTMATCRDPSVDDCRVDEECPESYQTCASTWSDTRFGCREMDCAIGRPLLVEDEVRSAPLADRGDWAAPVTAALAPAGLAAAALPPAGQRPAVAAHWAAVARMEHASVASFARFTLELLALGAPPELVAAAQAAGQDEVEHARLAFGLASAFAGAPVGPGPLNLRGATPALDLKAALIALIEEACVGETVGVVEARAAAVGAVPGVREVLEQIAEDEARHAALAWRCLRWMLQQRPDLAGVAAEALDRGIARVLDGGDEGGAAPDLRPWGLLGAAARDEARARAIAEVVRPCADALFSAVAEA